LNFEFSFMGSESFKGLGWLAAGWKLLYTRHGNFAIRSWYGSSIRVEERFEGRRFNPRGTGFVDTAFVVQHLVI
jgi:hypothetical protein